MDMDAPAVGLECLHKPVSVLKFQHTYIKERSQQGNTIATGNVGTAVCCRSSRQHAFAR